MDATAELGRNTVNKYQIQPECGDEQADAGRRYSILPNPSRETKFSGTNADREIFIFPVQLTTYRTGNLTGLVHTLAICVAIHYIYFVRARGGLNPCARESKARTGRFLREKLISDHGHFSSYEGHMEWRTGKTREAFSRMHHRALDGWMLARSPASPAQSFHHHGPRYFNFPYFCTMCGLEKLGINC